MTGAKWMPWLICYTYYKGPCMPINTILFMDSLDECEYSTPVEAACIKTVYSRKSFKLCCEIILIKELEQKVKVRDFIFQSESRLRAISNQIFQCATIYN